MQFLGQLLRGRQLMFQEGKARGIRIPDSCRTAGATTADLKKTECSENLSVSYAFLTTKFLIVFWWLCSLISRGRCHQLKGKTYTKESTEY